MLHNNDQCCIDNDYYHTTIYLYCFSNDYGVTFDDNCYTCDDQYSTITIYAAAVPTKYVVLYNINLLFHPYRPLLYRCRPMFYDNDLCCIFNYQCDAIIYQGCYSSDYFVTFDGLCCTSYDHCLLYRPLLQPKRPTLSGYTITTYVPTHIDHCYTGDIQYSTITIYAAFLTINVMPLSA